jgi:hypothetical protein
MIQLRMIEDEIAALQASIVGIVVDTTKKFGTCIKCTIPHALSVEDV